MGRGQTIISNLNLINMFNKFNVSVIILLIITLIVLKILSMYEVYPELDLFFFGLGVTCASIAIVAVTSYED